MGYLPYRYRPFGTFRLILALFVVCQHFVANAAPVGNLYATFLPYELGSLAVLVFFCLSGFVITEAVDQVYARKPAAYLINRFLRIVPHFVVAVVISIVIHRLFFDWGTLRIADREHPTLYSAQAFEWWNIGGNLLGFLPGANHVIAYDFVDIVWAVRVEMVFYFAVFFALLVRPMRCPIPVLLLALGIGCVFVARQFGLFFFFAYGVLLYDWRRHKRDLFASILGMMLYFALLPVRNHNRAVALQFVILAGLIATLTWLAFHQTQRRSFDRQCGDLSYPLYIYHQNMLILVISATAGYSYFVFFSGIALSLLTSYGLMRLVDPVVNRLRDIIRGRRLERPNPVVRPS